MVPIASAQQGAAGDTVTESESSSGCSDISPGAGEDRTGFPSGVADGQHQVELVVEVAVDVVRGVVGDVDPDFSHHANGDGMDGLGLDASAGDGNPFAADGLQPSMRHLRTGTVAGADHQESEGRDTVHSEPPGAGIQRDPRCPG